MNFNILKYYLCTLFLWISGFNLQAQKATHKLDNPITVSYLEKHLSKYSPKLILTPSIEQDLKNKIKSDPLFEEYHKTLQREGEAILEEPLLKRELEGFRLLLVSREMVARMGVLSLLYRLDKDPIILDRINQELIAVCNFSDWNPIHYLDVAEMCFAVSTAVDWVGEFLPLETVDLAKTALVEKGIMPSYNVNGVRMFWVNSANNWNTICHSGMIVASLIIADREPELAAKTIARALDKITSSLNEYGPDGVYPEGPSYWAYGTSYGVIASNVLTTALGSDFGISASPGFMNSANFRLMTTAPSGAYFNFADSDGSHNGSGAALLAWFAIQTGDALYYDDQFLNNPKSVGRKLLAQCMIWISQYKKKKSGKLPLSWVGRGANPIVVFRSENKDSSQFYFAGKGGKARLTHGNMDAGSFVFELNGVRWAIDPGNQRYYLLNKIGFELSNLNQDSERWTLLTKGNKNHNTVTINDARFNVDGFAPIIDFKNSEKPEATVDMTEIYNGSLNYLYRKYIKESNSSIAIVDSFEINEQTHNVTWSMMTTADVIPIKNGAILKQDGQTLHLSIVSPDNLNVSIISLDPPPLEIDKSIDNLKRIEINVPSYLIKNSLAIIKVRLSESKI
jgi:hypothetical protein